MGATIKTSSSSLLGPYESMSNVVAISIFAVLALQVLYTVSLEAYKIRMYAIEEYGPVIHEFDPYFNYRATEYLYANGWKAFSQWFDYMVWYPLGRPVGTTIYPGMQVTSVFIKNHILPDWSINDICCYVPSWFGVLATLAVAFLTYETTRNDVRYESILHTIPGVRTIYDYVIDPAGQFLLQKISDLTGSTLGFSKTRLAPPSLPLWTAASAAAIMAVLPAHLMRSIGGGYDNESIAMTAMVLTFACWTRALADQPSLIVTTVWGVITGLAYFYMVAAWGGFTFVLNLVGVHASFLVLTGRYSTKVHRAYTAFYVVGTTLAIQVPVVGWTPLKSLEQLGPFLAFGGIQLIEICEEIRRRRKKQMSSMEMWKLRVMVFGAAAAVALVLIYVLLPTGYFGPLSSRVRGLFVKHTKTGNPLVDSVAEHQAAKPEAYQQYLRHALYLSPFGLGLTTLFYYNDSSSFLLVYAIAAYYFSHRMVRLILLTAPIASCLAGIAIGRFMAWCASGLLSPAEEDKTSSTTSKSKKKKSKNGSNAKKGPTTSGPLKDAMWGRVVRVAVGVVAGLAMMSPAKDFYDNSHQLAQALSHPTIIQKAQTRDGQIIKLDDYRQAYFWLRDNTPEDARIMAWWDYGYQITGIANRTTIADGNTWNHEHIALLGRILTGPEKEAHRIARHLADYVLVWAGGGGDDIAKSPHLRRIANSVYRGLCKDPLCGEFGFYSDRTPTTAMGESMLYKLVGNGMMPGIEVDNNRFREVFRSKYGKVRIYKIQSVSQESKEWVADPANRVCDAPGSWFCRGQYPPALEKILAEKKDFKQLEDFNAKGADDSDYQKEYFERLLNKKMGNGAQLPPKPRVEGDAQGKKPKLQLDAEDIEIINENWENNDLTTLMWQVIADNRMEDFAKLLSETPTMVHIRSEDGRGPMWWAHEFGRAEMVEVLKKFGASEARKDAKGLTPLDVSKL
uniref:dolichyl-diphosphooligosaccharide--protein glycotransferase n=1 Tax=Amphora coffeiformis TaxID=265554 RepID=A0A7S3PAI1_9STRA